MLSLLGIVLLGAGQASAPPPCSTLENCLAFTNTTNPEQCVAALSFASGRWPQSIDAHRALALCLDVLDRHREALEAEKRCLALSPGYAPCLSLMGYTLWALDKKDEARACFERVISAQMVEGRFPHALKALATMAIDDEDTVQARKYLDTAWGLAKQDETKASLHRLEASLALVQRNGDEALARLKRAEALCGWRVYRVLQAFVLAWQGRFPEGLAVARTLDGVKLEEKYRVTCDWLDAVLRRKAERKALRAWADADAKNDLRWFLLALDAHLAGNEAAACALLGEGRRRAGCSMLRPPWSEAPCRGAQPAGGRRQ